LTLGAIPAKIRPLHRTAENIDKEQQIYFYTDFQDQSSSPNNILLIGNVQNNLPTGTTISSIINLEKVPFSPLNGNKKTPMEIVFCFSLLA
tara:strand:+ start:585 stop:857 length:273 start_codon:yes stop_codon:yes gene_type:complete